MKKLLLVFTLVTVSFSSAQELSYGFKAGLNVASLAGDLDDLDPRLGLHAGVFAEFRLSEKFSIQSELLFSQQGAKESYFDQGSFDGFSYREQEDITYIFNYINIPVLAKVYLTDKFSIEAGPQISLLMNARLKYDYYYEEQFNGTVIGSESESGTESIKDEVKALDFGFNFGFGYDINPHFLIQTRYALGLSNIVKVSDFDEDFSIKNGVFQISIGYRF